MTYPLTPAAARWGRTTLRALSLGTVALSLGLWVRAKTVDQDERGNAERRALFVGMWPPMVWLLGDAVADAERGGR